MRNLTVLLALAFSATAAAGPIGAPLPPETANLARDSMKAAWTMFVRDEGLAGSEDIMLAMTGSWANESKDRVFHSLSDVDATCRGCSPDQARRLQDKYDEVIASRLASNDYPDEVHNYFARNDRNVYDGTQDRLQRNFRSTPATDGDVGKNIRENLRLSQADSMDTTKVAGADTADFVDKETAKTGGVLTTDGKHYRGGEALERQRAFNGKRVDMGRQNEAVSFREQERRAYSRPPLDPEEAIKQGKHPLDPSIEDAAKGRSRLNDTRPAYSGLHRSDSAVSLIADKENGVSISKALEGYKDQAISDAADQVAAEKRGLTAQESKLYREGIKDRAAGRGDTAVGRYADQIAVERDLDVKSDVEQVRGKAETNARKQFIGEQERTARTKVTQAVLQTNQITQTRQGAIAQRGDVLGLANDIGLQDSEDILALQRMDIEDRNLARAALPPDQRADFDRKARLADQLNQGRVPLMEQTAKEEALKKKLAKAEGAGKAQVQRELKDVQIEKSKAKVRFEDSMNQVEMELEHNAKTKAKARVSKPAGPPPPPPTKLQKVVDSCVSDKSCRSGMGGMLREIPPGTKSTYARTVEVGGKTFGILGDLADMKEMYDACSGGDAHSCASTTSKLAMEALVPQTAIITMSAEMVASATRSGASAMEDQAVYGMYRGGRRSMGLLGEMGVVGGTRDEDREGLFGAVVAHVNATCGEACPPGSDAFRNASKAFIQERVTQYVKHSETDMDNLWLRLDTKDAKSYEWQNSTIDKLTKMAQADMDRASVDNMRGPILERIDTLDQALEEGVALSPKRRRELLDLKGTIWDMDERAKASECTMYVWCPDEAEIQAKKDAALKVYYDSVGTRNMANKKNQNARLAGLTIADPSSQVYNAPQSGEGKYDPSSTGQPDTPRFEPKIDVERIAAFTSDQDKLDAMIAGGDYESAMYAYVGLGRGNSSDAIRWIKEQAALNDLSKQKAAEEGRDLTAHIDTMAESLAASYSDARQLAADQTFGLGSFREDIDESGMNRVASRGEGQSASSWGLGYQPTSDPEEMEMLREKAAYDKALADGRAPTQAQLDAHNRYVAGITSNIDASREQTSAQLSNMADDIVAGIHSTSPPPGSGGSGGADEYSWTCKMHPEKDPGGKVNKTVTAPTERDARAQICGALKLPDPDLKLDVSQAKNLHGACGAALNCTGGP